MSLKKMEMVNELMNEFANMLEVDAILAESAQPELARIIAEYAKTFEDLRIEILRVID